jgi:hypothetical protein
MNPLELPGSPAPPKSTVNPLDLKGVTQLPIPAPPKATPGPYGDIIASSASMVGMPIDMARRQVAVESSFNPNARNKSSGAIGLMQLMPGTAKDLGVNPYDAHDNIAGGVKYMHEQYKAFGSWGNALAAYNWGPGNVEAWLGRGGGFQHLPKETQDYIKKIAPQEAAMMMRGTKDLASSGPLGKPLAQVASTNPLDLGGAVIPKPTPSAGQAPKAPPPRPSLQSPDLGAMWTGVAHAMDTVAGHQDLPFIWENAFERDHQMDPSKSGLEFMRDPNSNLAKAMKMWRENPVAAMDEFGMGSTPQYKWMSEHSDGAGQAFAKFMLSSPYANAANTFLSEGVNPMSAVEGAGLGKLAGLGGRLARSVPWLENLHITDRLAHGMGPMFAIAVRSGKQGIAWANSLLNNLAAPHELLHMLPTAGAKGMTEKVFGGLDADAQKQVILTMDRDPAFFEKVKAAGKDVQEIDGVPIDIARRGLAMKTDTEEITAHKLRTKVIKPDQVRQNYVNMVNAYEFDANGTLEDLFHGTGSTQAHGEKSYETMKEALESEYLPENFLPARQFANWREQSLRKISFEDSMGRAPRSLRIAPEPGLRAKLKTGPVTTVKDVQGNTHDFRTFEGKTYGYAKDPKKWISPAIRSGAAAPELVRFIMNDKNLKSYLKAGTMAQGTGQGVVGTFIRKANGLARAMVIANFMYHPIVNIAGNDAAQRGLRNLGGNQWEKGGYMLNAATAAAQQFGLDPKRFVASAQQYQEWLDRAMKAGAVSSFPLSRDTPLSFLTGSDRASLTQPVKAGAKGWLDRMDRQLQRFADFNAERTFGEKGEESFAVHLFKDAIESGKMSDADAAVMVRSALGDYHNLNPDNVLSILNFFMPWRAGNWRKWTEIMLKKPNYVTGTTHAIRNRNIETDPDQVYSAFPPGQFTLQGGLPGLEKVPGINGPYQAPFVGRDAGKISDMVGSLWNQDFTQAGNNAEQLLTGSAKPLTRIGLEAHNSIAAGYDPKDVVGPESSFAYLWNAKAPAGGAQTHQILRSLMAQLPMPADVFSDSIRKGFRPEDIITGIAEIIGLGRFGDKTSEDTRVDVGRAKKEYLKAWQSYYYNDHDHDALVKAWGDYMQAMTDAGALH